MTALTDLQKIKKLIERSFDQQPWYGPSVMDTLNDITPQKAANRLLSSHSIIELVGHMTAWRKFVIAQLEGNPREVEEEDNFPLMGEWKDALTELKQSQRELMQAMDHFPEDKLNDQVPMRNYRFHFMLNGIIQHDIYHCGQIALLKKL